VIHRTNTDTEAAVLVSFPLTTIAHDVARDIAASGVSEDGFTDGCIQPGPVAWRTRTPAANRYLVPPPGCPECGTVLMRASACITCPGCGWGKCG
jgi:hypothetical protein